MGPNLKINLGCGQNPVPGYLNVDKYGEPEILWDLEQFPWPWEDNSVEEILLTHVLEHIGEETGTHIKILKELYRICRDGALVRITVPHPRHDDFMNDPTHVRVITPAGLRCFSKKKNREWAEKKLSNSPLALYHDIDFDISDILLDLDEPWLSRYRKKEITDIELDTAARQFNNVIKQVRITLKAVKSSSAPNG